MENYGFRKCSDSCKTWELSNSVLLLNKVKALSAECCDKHASKIQSVLKS